MTNTLQFDITGVGKTTELDILEAAEKIIIPNDIRAIQIAGIYCRITLKNEDAKRKLHKGRLIINGKLLFSTVAGRDTSRVTIKDAPVEMHDKEIISTLSA